VCRDRNLLTGYASLEQLTTENGAYIDGQGRRRRFATQGLMDLGPDLVTVAADRGAKMGAQLGGFCAQAPLERLDAARNDAGCRTSPACVQQGHGAPVGMNERHRHTVGKRNGQPQTWSSGQMSVAGF
jgi:hypothetical protein